MAAAMAAGAPSGAQACTTLAAEYVAVATARFEAGRAQGSGSDLGHAKLIA